MSKRTCACLLACGFLLPGIFGCQSFPGWVLRRPPRRGQHFPDLALRAPETAVERSYLGLSENSSRLRLSEVKADIVIVVFVDMYCRFCQKGAAQTVALYRAIEASNLAAQVKLVGVALGNSEFEAGLFRSKYQLPFPLFADPASEVRTRLGRVATPSFFALNVADGSLTVLASRSGVFDDEPMRFLERAVRAGGVVAP